MAYILKLKDISLLEFEMASEGRELLVEILRVNVDATSYFPLDWSYRETADLNALADSLRSWLRHRSIPSNRAYVNSFLSRMGLSEFDVAGIMKLCRGLSLNDSYWIDETDNEHTFDEVNLYDNPFSNIIAQIAFTGTGESGVPGLSASPEFTTNGAYAKCWRRLDGTVYLFKEGSVGAANAGGEPYAEYYASNLANAVGFDATEYVPARWKGHFCSKCPLFTSKDLAFVSAARLVKTGELSAVASFYRDLGPEFFNAFADMLVFDALILNTDRHYSNFGVLIDSNSNEIAAPAPLFDHGCSLLYQAMKGDFDNLDAYVATQLPRAYSSFVEEARRYMGPAQREKLRHVLEFSFAKHTRYNWPDWRLRALESLIHAQARELLSA